MTILDTTALNSANKVVSTVINTAWDLGLTKADAYSAKVSAAVEGFLDVAETPKVTAKTVASPTIAEPNVDIPATQSAGDALAAFDSKYAAIIADLAARFTAFRDTYFPDESDSYLEAETWLRNVLENDKYGLPPEIAEQMLGDDIARIVSDKVRAQDAVLAQFAARRFPLPPDAAASAVLQIEQAAQAEIAKSSRALSAQLFEAKKFSADKLLNLRQVAMESAVSYIKTMASAPDVASSVVAVGYDAQSKLISSAAQFYNARTQAAEVVTKVAQYNNSAELEAAMKNQSAELTIIEDRLKVMLAEAQALAQQATALFNNVHVSAGISNSRNTSVGFNYSNDTASAAPTTTDVW